MTYWVNVYVRNGKTEPGIEHDTRYDAVESAIASLAMSKMKYTDDATLNSRVRVTLK